MATLDMPIMGFATIPDTGGLTFLQPIEVGVATAAANLDMLAMTIENPSAGGDQGFYGKFTIAQNYVDTPVLVIRGIIDGTPGTETLAFGFQQTGGIADKETADVAFQAEDTAGNSTWTGYVDEEIYVETIAITPTAAYVAGDEVFYYFYRDDSADDHPMDFHVTGLFFRYNDA